MAKKKKNQMKQVTQVQENQQEESQQEVQPQESQMTQEQESQQEVKVETQETQEMEQLDSPTQLDNQQGKKNQEKVENLQAQLKIGSSLLSSNGQKPNVYRLRDYLIVQANPSKELKKLVANGIVDETLHRAIKIEMQRLGHVIE